MPDRESIAEEVRDIVACILCVGHDTFSESDTLEDIGADSLDLVDIVMEAEQVWDIDIGSSFTEEKGVTVGDLIDEIMEHRR